MTDYTDLKARLLDAVDGATRGPWVAHYNDHYSEVARLDGDFTSIADVHEYVDALLIAAARQLVPEALAAIDALEADIARLQTAHVQMQRAHDDLAAENARLREHPQPTVALSKRQLFSHVVTPVVTHDDGSQTMIDQSGNGNHWHVPPKGE